MKIPDELTLRDYFAINAPQPDPETISMWHKIDKGRNPYNYPDKPKIRSTAEIVADLRYEFSDIMLAARSEKKKEY